MEFPSTPVNKAKIKPKGSSLSPFMVPPSPMMTTIGYGTGVCVYHFQRKVKEGCSSSPWAIKKIQPNYADHDFATRLAKEAQILKSLSHPNIVGFRGFTKTEDGREVLAMEECSMSLADLMEERLETTESAFPPDKIRLVGTSIARALDYLHNEKGLVHGDIKSHNVLVKGDWEAVKLCDFGVTLKIGAPVTDWVGTGLWSAPECLDSDSNDVVTPAADIFSLGLVLFEMLTLHHPHLNTFESFSSSVETDMEQTLPEPDFGTRPELSVENFGPEYLSIIEAFTLCTEQQPSLRPTASKLISMLSSENV